MPGSGTTPRDDEARLDETLAESFPASDPVAIRIDRGSAATPPQPDRPADRAG
jgi:hypothetical protein